MNRSRSFRLSCLVTAGFVAVCVFAAEVSAETRWQRSPETVLASARTSGKPIVVYVSTQWCHYCKKMNVDTWADESVSTLLNQRFHPLALDGDRDRQIVERLRLTGYPATLLFAPSGEYIAKQPGYMSPTQAMQWLGQALR